MTMLRRGGWRPVAGTAQIPLYPTAASTGPAAGGYASLTPVTISADTEIKNTPYPSWVTAGTPLTVTGVAFAASNTIDVYVNSVTFTGCSFISSAAAGSSGPLAINLRGTGPYVFNYCTICGSDGTSATRIMVAINMITDCALTVTNCNIYYMKQAVNIFSGTVAGVTITGNYMHDIVLYTGDHSEHIYGGSTSAGGNNITVSGNTLLNPLNQTACLYLNNVNPFTNCTVTGNLMAGGGYCVYAGNASSTGIVVTNNVVSTVYYATGGYYGALYPTSPPVWGSSGNVWSGNSWLDGPNAGATI